MEVKLGKDTLAYRLSYLTVLNDNDEGLLIYFNLTRMHIVQKVFNIKRGSKY